MATQSAAVLRHISKLIDTERAEQRSDRELLRRFAGQHDEAAFATLVRRHGPMVLRVCRRALAQEQDAEDVFQAVFLILARKAGVVRWRESVAGWLQAAAVRLARKARAELARRAAHARSTETRTAPDPLEEITGRELLRILDEELARLPENYRSPLLLCCLESNTQEEAARQLGWSLSTLRRRLERGRELLRTRLARRDVALSAALAGVLVLPSTTSAALPAGLLATTTRAAFASASGAVGSAISASVARLVEEGVKLTAATKLKLATTMVLAVSMLATGLGVISPSARSEKQWAEPSVPAAKAPQAAKKEEPKKARTDRYGDPLPEGAIARMGTVRFQHGRLVSSVAFSRDGKTLLSGSYDGTVRLWDRDTGKELRRFAELLPYGVVRLAFSRDGKTAAALAGDSRIRFWEVATGKQLGWIEGGFSFAFASDGKTVATGDVGDGLIQLLDWPSGRELRRLQGHKGRVFCVAFSPDGRSLASAGRDNTIRLWDPGTGRELRRLEGDIHAPFFAPQFLAFSPDSQTIACGTGTKTIRLWDTATGRELRQFRDAFGEVWVVAFSPDGRILATGSHARMCLWEVATGKELRQLKTTYYPGQPSIVFSPDGKTVATGTEDGLIHLWDVGTGQEISPAGGHRHWIWSLALSADAKVLASAGYDGDIRLWETATGRELQHIKADTRGLYVYSVALAPNGKTLVWGSEDKIIHVWDLAASHELRRIEGHQERVAFVALLPDGKTLVSGSGDGTIRLWDLAAGKELRRLGEAEKLFPLALSPDGKHLAAIAMGGGGPIRMLEVSTGKERGQLDTGREHPRTTKGAFSPDGRILASAGLQDSMICLWDVSTRKLLRQIKREKFKDVEHTPMLFEVAFSPDGKSLVSAEEASTIFVWEVATGQKRAVLAGHQGPVHSLAFSADGRLLVTGSADTSALVWDMTGGTPQRRQEAAKVTEKELRALWTDLASDASKAYEAILTLTAAAERSVPYLRGQLRAVPAAEPARLAQLMKDLDSEQFAVREKATQELEKLGESAETALRKTLEAHPSPEVRRRADQLLEKLEWTKSPERLRRVRALEVLEKIGTPDAAEVLKNLAQGAPEARLTQEAKAALDRLAKRSMLAR